MKIWIDETKPAPHGYTWCKTIQETKETILSQEKLRTFALNSARYQFANDNHQYVEEYLEEARSYSINLIDINHQINDNELIHFLAAKNLEYPIQMH